MARYVRSQMTSFATAAAAAAAAATQSAGSWTVRDASARPVPAAVVSVSLSVQCSNLHMFQIDLSAIVTTAHYAHCRSIFNSVQFSLERIRADQKLIRSAQKMLSPKMFHCNTVQYKTSFGSRAIAAPCRPAAGTNVNQHWLFYPECRRFWLYAFFRTSHSKLLQFA